MSLEPLESDPESGKASITPLRGRRPDGTPYTRVAETEAALLNLLPLSRGDLVARCTVQQRNDPGYVPSECLLYFVRACRADDSCRHFEDLYKLLAGRVLRSLPKGGGSNREIREEVFDQFVELLAMDRKSYQEKLDFYEVRFDQALFRRRKSAEKKVWRDENRSAVLEADRESGEFSAEVERAVGSISSFDFSQFEAADYRLWLDAAIDSLPQLQRRIVHMIREEIPIDSINPGTVTIAKALGKSEKTIRTHRDKAFAALREALKEER